MTDGFSPSTEVSRLIVAILAAFLLAPTGPSQAADAWACRPDNNTCRTVFIVHDSWHAAIVLRRDDLSRALFPELADFAEARFIEFSWGDKDYFPDPESGFSLALKAAFWSSGSVLHLVAVDDELQKFYPKAEIIELSLASSAFARLVGFLSESFVRPDPNEAARASPGLYSYSRFYPSGRKFSLLNTCNTWVAQALTTAGLPLAPNRVITAGQLGAQLDEIKAAR